MSNKLDFILVPIRTVFVNPVTFVVLIKQLTFSGNLTDKIKWLYKISVVSFSMHKQTEKACGCFI